MKNKTHTGRYGLIFFLLCVVVLAWQFFFLVADLRVMGRGTDEWLSLPLAISHPLTYLSPFNGLFITMNGKLGGVGMFHTSLISIANALLILSPYWLLRRRRWLVWIPLVLITVWCLMQVCYCRAYDDLMPWRSLTLTENVNSTLMGSTLALLRWHDILFVLPLLFLWAMSRLNNVATPGTTSRVKPFLFTLLATVVIAFFGYYIPRENHAKRYLVNFSNRSYYSLNGFIPYLAFSLYQSVFNGHSVSDADRERVRRFLDEECPHYDDNRFAGDTRRNLVLFIVESLHTWPIGMEVDGKEVTPVLNRLVQGDRVIYAPHVLFQTSHGHSSDAHFIYNTGLLPLRDGVVAVDWGSGPYPTLADALEDYDCREIICTPGMNWNQTVTSRTYGFDSLYTRDNLNQADMLRRHNGVDDAALTDFAASLLPEVRQPFFMEMVTMTMHAPYINRQTDPTWITRSDTLTAEARGYLDCVHLTDSCIGAFIDDLQRMQMAENTVVAIVSDHTQVYLNRVKGLTDYASVLDDWGIPLIIAGCDTTLRYEPVIGQVDVYPTLLDVMGANAYPWKGLGHSILRYPVMGAIQPRNMSVLGDSTSLTTHQREAWDISRLLIFDGCSPIITKYSSQISHQ
ncbi:MAG: sulfatase-like hydrolase/transferase [Muribaculaceae bacterium]|nr:sulfatase-like hydrolase/transferase [Muribaculaceae bacterium]